MDGTETLAIGPVNYSRLLFGSHRLVQPLLSDDFVRQPQLYAFTYSFSLAHIPSFRSPKLSSSRLGNLANRICASSRHAHFHMLGMLKTNGPPFRMGQARRRSLPSPTRLRAGRSPFCRAHVLEVRSARRHKGVPLLDKLSNCALRDAASKTAAFPSAGSGQDWMTFLIIPVGYCIEIF
jgi:hypothetical protein